MRLLRIKLLDERCRPQRSYESDSGLDLRLRSEKPLTLNPFQPKLVKTGIAIELPPGCEAQVRPRSSLTRRGILMPFGTVDNGYRGEVRAVVINITPAAQILEAFERVAQLVVAPVCIPEIEYCEELSVTERGESGFGSTGRV